jgi:SPX domain protein involved in polyphosphate accumulation
MKDNAVCISAYRYEKKFFITDLSKYEVENLVKIHPHHFSEIFFERSINNIYFDSIKWKYLHDNLEGATNRTKVRIRWYGEMFGYVEKPTLEIKNKAGSVGNKISIPISPFEFSQKTEIREIIESLDKNKDILKIDFKSLQPAILSGYRRKYFISNDGKYRITIDTNQIFYRISNSKNVFLDKYNDNNSVILEMKYNTTDHEFSESITSQFPFRVTKSSKYVNGLEKVFKVLF